MPEYQGKGIGTDIVNALLNHIQREIQPGTFVSVGRSATEGKEGFLRNLVLTLIVAWASILNINRGKE